jgi:arginase family enzyme
MDHFVSLSDFLEPVNLHELSQDEGYRDTQLGKNSRVYGNKLPEIENADLVIVGCGENRGFGSAGNFSDAPNAVRKEFYSLYQWHSDLQLADVGNVRSGATVTDTYAALRSVVGELIEHNKRVVIIGGSHDLTLGQYQAYAAKEKIIEATCVDAKIDLDMDSPVPSDHFLMKMLVGEPNFVKHYNHIGFQSYFVHPHMLETIDKIRFDCYRLGRVKESIESMEPVIRNSNLFSFDISAIQHSHAPVNKLTPNGFNGEEACTLMQYAGMSMNVDTIGLYGYVPQEDQHNMTARQLAHMLWYLMDGIAKGKQEARLEDRDYFNEFKMAFAEVETTFLQSKKTGRWWMEAPDGKMIACSHLDYMAASSNDIPERWMRVAERP